jgi:alkylhydroperoxidase family enzyme
VTWLTTAAPGPTSFEQTLGLRPDLLERYRDLYERLWTERLVDPVLLELCRLRIAQLHRSESELSIRYEAATAAGLDEAKVGELASWPTSPRFTEHERACLAYAEKLVIDVHAITDEESAAVAAGMTPAEHVAFTLALGLFDGLGRFRVLLGIDEPLAEITVVPGPGERARTLY